MPETITMRQQFVEWYLDYCNDFISIDGFAEYFGISVYQAKQIIQLGREIMDQKHPEE